MVMKRKSQSQIPDPRSHDQSQTPADNTPWTASGCVLKLAVIRFRSVFLQPPDFQDKSREGKAKVLETIAMNQTDANANANPRTTDKKLQDDKIITMFVIFVLTLTSQFLPWIIHSYNLRAHKSQRFTAAILDILLSLSTGVILGAAFCHVFPDAEDAFSTYFSFYTDQNGNVPGLPMNGTDYPFTGFIMISTLLVLVSVDQLLSKRGITGANANLEFDPRSRISEQAREQGHDQREAHDAHSHGIAEILFLKKKETLSRAIPLKATPLCSCPPNSCTCDTEINKECMTENKCEGVDEAVVSRKILMVGTSPVQAYVFFMSLSLHAFIEGLSIGSEPYLDGAFWSLFIAIVGHKVLDGLALGIPFYHSALSMLHIVICFVISAAMGPLGIVTGMVITQDSSLSSTNSSLAIAIMLSMACGSFLYISFIEMFPAIFRNLSLIKTKLALLFLGFGLMAIIAIFF